MAGCRHLIPWLSPGSRQALARLLPFPRGRIGGGGGGAEQAYTNYISLDILFTGHQA